jgi:hypothetical protein
MSVPKIRSGLQSRKEGLPAEAFAIVGEANDPATWKLPHHTRAIFRALKGRLDIERTVDWQRMAAAVAALSPGGYRGRRVEATSEQILAAAHHLASHYQKAGQELPSTLADLLGSS